MRVYHETFWSYSFSNSTFDIWGERALARTPSEHLRRCALRRRAADFNDLSTDIGKLSDGRALAKSETVRTVQEAVWTSDRERAKLLDWTSLKTLWALSDPGGGACEDRCKIRIEAY